MINVFQNTGPKLARSAKATYFRAALVAISLCYTLPGNSQVASEYEIKAAYIEKVARFIDWPDNSLENSKTINICVIGENPFENILNESYQTRTLKNKEVVISELVSVEDLAYCHLLFISKDKAKELPEILKLSRQYNILTFSDTDGYAQKGVHVNFYMKDERVLFEINHCALDSCGFKAVSLLLDYARIVDTCD